FRLPESGNDFSDKDFGVHGLYNFVGVRSGASPLPRQTFDKGTIITVKLLPGVVVAALAGQREIKIGVLKLSHKFANLIDRRRFFARRETNQIFVGRSADCRSEVCRRQAEVGTRGSTTRLDRIDIRPTR